MTFPPLSIGGVIAIVVLVLAVVLSVVRGPTVELGLIGALAVARLT
jgi:hypothetical protein